MIQLFVNGRFFKSGIMIHRNIKNEGLRKTLVISIPLKKMEASVKEKEVKKTNEQILETPIYLNWFGVYTHDGIPLERPTQEKSCFYPDFDQDVAEGQKHWDILKKAVVFPDFYLDDQIGIVSLLRNDNLEITLTVLNIGNERNIEFVEAKTLGELILKFPLLKQYVNKNVNRKLSAMQYHPNNDLT